MIANSRQLMDRIKSLIGNYSTKVQVALRLYAMERFLDRLVRSPWQDRFIVKEGALVIALVGVALRATMDIDATVRGIALDEVEIEKVITRICAIEVGDGVTFRLKTIDRIMNDCDYLGIRLSMEALFDRVRIPMKLDFSTDDAVTPGVVEFRYPLLLGDGEIPLMAYNLEPCLRKSLRPLCRVERPTRGCGISTTYLSPLRHRGERIDPDVLNAAVAATIHKRETDLSRDGALLVLSEVRSDSRMQEMWGRYQEKAEYARDVPWDKAVTAAVCLLGMLEIA